MFMLCVYMCKINFTCTMYILCVIISYVNIINGRYDTSMVVMIGYDQWSLWYVMILHVFSIKIIPLLRPLGLSPQGGSYRGILLYIGFFYDMTLPVSAAASLCRVGSHTIVWGSFNNQRMNSSSVILPGFQACNKTLKQFAAHPLISTLLRDISLLTLSTYVKFVSTPLPYSWLN